MTVSNTTPRWYADFTKNHVSMISFTTPFTYNLPLTGGSSSTTFTYTYSGSFTEGNLMATEDTTITVTETPCVVPGVVNESQASATSSLEDAGCTVGAVTQAQSATVAVGNVISSSPAEGTQLAPLAPVALVVSKGKKGKIQCVVPKVAGQPLATAEAALTAAMCTVGKVTKKASATVPSGDVISTSPAAGASKPVGSPVALTVSNGKAAKNKCTVPSLGGKTLAAAKNALKKAKCAVGKVTNKTSSTVKKGRVISSSPAAGKVKPKGTKVALKISKGAAATKKCTVPNVKGKKLAAARKAISKAHCAVGKVTKKKSSKKNKGKVLSEAPAAGAVKPKGAKVKLTVGK
jgi:serine/threonine-protein kinase